MGKWDRLRLGVRVERYRGARRPCQRVATAQPPMRTPETSEMRRTRCEVEAIRAKLPATPNSAPDAKQRAPFVELSAAMFARREAIKKAKAGKTE